uniref:Uncharacterized protein n=1 Tax=Cyanoderma ruficeps TaxID=181631 RepID=A0A8C3QKJ5_9PASS
MEDRRIFPASRDALQAEPTLGLLGKSNKQTLFFCFFRVAHKSHAAFSFPVVFVRSHFPQPEFSHVCPDTWPGFQGKYCYFSEPEGNWPTGQERSKAWEKVLLWDRTLTETAARGKPVSMWSPPISSFPSCLWVMEFRHLGCHFLKISSFKAKDFSSQGREMSSHFFHWCRSFSSLSLKQESSANRQFLHPSSN